MLIQRETGGNLVEVLDKTTVAASRSNPPPGRDSNLHGPGSPYWLDTLSAPHLMFFTLTAINPNYTTPLLTEPLGQQLLVGRHVFMLLGILVIRKIVRIKV